MNYTATRHFHRNSGPQTSHKRSKKSSVANWPKAITQERLRQKTRLRTTPTDRPP